MVTGKQGKGGGATMLWVRKWSWGQLSRWLLPSQPSGLSSQGVDKIARVTLHHAQHPLG